MKVSEGSSNYCLAHGLHPERECQKCSALTTPAPDAGDEQAADRALESAIEGGGFIERPYTRYRYHNGFLAGIAYARASEREERDAYRGALEVVADPFPGKPEEGWRWPDLWKNLGDMARTVLAEYPKGGGG